MDRSSTFRIPVTPDVLRAASAEPVPPSVLVEPLQALVTGINRRTAQGPLSIYLGADDASRQMRDDVAHLLARALAAHVPSALLVDCDFLHPGMHGLVPQKDALGFLDFLLYGSSIGVITQEAQGVRVVGTGSFPVSRRMPFVEAAFAEASRRLAAHARCAIFVGPLTDEEGNPHPLTAEVDVVTVAASGERSPALAMADRIAEQAPEVWIIQMGAVLAPRPEPEPVRPRAEAPPVLPTGVPPRPAPAAAEPKYSSRGPRIAIIAFGVVVIAFAVWWFSQDRGVDMGTSEEAQPATTTQAREPEPAPLPADTAAALRPDTAATVAAADTARDSGASGVRPPQSPADTGGRTGGTQLLSAEDIHVMADLEARWTDWYMIHISSFQESIRAREEVTFLQSREFPVFIVFLDLGAKGKWYRVYCGPFRTRDEAREVKKNLDAVPQVRFTRIAKIPE